MGTSGDRRIDRLADELIVCTRNRSADLRRCLEAVAVCAPIPDSILVVDSSDTDESEHVVKEMVRDRGMNIEYMRSSPGLTVQRNAGVRRSTASIVHFIDDDTVPEPSYFGAVVRCFEDMGPPLLGVCGQITNLPPRKRVGWASRVFALDGEEGTVLKSGRNQLVFHSDHRRRVQWLSGCSMSYRRDVLLQEKFDETLKGYALGEDVDLSTRCARLGSLIYEPSARIAHLESSVERWAVRRRTRVELANRHLRVKRRFAGESLPYFWWSCVGQVVVNASKTIVRQSRFNARNAWWTLEGMVDILIDRRP
jgi:GT2 family glycosyltransferase